MDGITIDTSVTAAAAGLAALLSILVAITLARLGRLGRAGDDVAASLAAVEAALDDLARGQREEGRAARDELRSILAAHQHGLEARLSGFAKQQVAILGEIRREAAEGRAILAHALGERMDGFAASQGQRLRETAEAMVILTEELRRAGQEAREVQRIGLENAAAQIRALNESNEQRQEAIRTTLAASLDRLRLENGEKLEQMRATVDEKLQGTLEARLGESFKLVSDRLELVHRGLGEMQGLAVGVGDLKRVLTNVKVRGGWGEVQLKMLLDDLLTRDQYLENARIRPDSGEMVEFAIRLPGRDEGAPVLLAIDSKFPQEDYERLIGAQEAGRPEEVERAALALERAIRLQAKTISDKYIHPPHSTDFAILYLPTEGLFAEVARRPGLCGEIQQKSRVMLTGPTTLAALLTSLQLGFRTLAIEKRSSEVWQVLGAAKAEFGKYAKVWEKLGNQLETARRTVDEAGRRTRAVERRLRGVEVMDTATAERLIPFDAGEPDEVEDAAAAE